MTAATPPSLTSGEIEEAEVMRIWRECGLPEYFLGNGGTNHRLVAFAKACSTPPSTAGWRDALLEDLAKWFEGMDADYLTPREIAENLRAGVLSPPAPSQEGEQPTPWPTGTELALAEAKRHIATLIAFWMDNPGWADAADKARAFISGAPSQEGASDGEGEDSSGAVAPPFDQGRATPSATPAAPYPFCRTPDKCAGKGYCPQDIACND